MYVYFLIPNSCQKILGWIYIELLILYPLYTINVFAINKWVGHVLKKERLSRYPKKLF